MSRERVAVVVGTVIAGLWGLYFAWPWVRGAELDVAAPRKAGRRTAPRPHANEAVWHRDADVTRAPAPDGSVNVVLVIGCTLRKDQLTPYGGPPQTTPFLASLARDGARFDDALSTSSWTREASVGWLTGQHAASLAMSEPGPRHSRRVLPEAAHTIAETLRDAGWTTLGVTANPNLNHEFGFGQGFDVYRDSLGFARQVKLQGAQVVDLALDMLDGRDVDAMARPFYLQLVLIDAHTPRSVEPDERARFVGPGIPDLVVDYRALLRRVDDSLVALDEGLSARGYATDDTLWVFVADHGEGLSMPAEHLPGHGKRMFGSTVEVPWIVRGPGVAAGHRIRGLASGIDLLPTLAGLVGVPPPGSLGGIDLSAWVHGDPGPTPRTEAWALSMYLRADLASWWSTDRQCQSGYATAPRRQDQIARGCFDRRTDPTFTRPLDDEERLVALDAWRAARLAEGSAHALREHQVDGEVGGQLEALGYVE